MRPVATFDVSELIASQMPPLAPPSVAFAPGRPGEIIAYRISFDLGMDRRVPMNCCVMIIEVDSTYSEEAFLAWLLRVYSGFDGTHAGVLLRWRNRRRFMKWVGERRPLSLRGWYGPVPLGAIDLGGKMGI